MRNIFFNLLALLVITTTVASAQKNNSGLISVTSRLDFNTTVKEIEKQLAARQLQIVVKVDHQSNATQVGERLTPNTMILFANPKLGTALLQASPSIGIDLPLKLQIVEGEAKKVVVTYNDPAYLAQRHGLALEMPAIQKMSSALKAMTDEIQQTFAR